MAESYKAGRLNQMLEVREQDAGSQHGKNFALCDQGTLRFVIFVFQKINEIKYINPNIWHIGTRQIRFHISTQIVK